MRAPDGPDARSAERVASHGLDLDLAGPNPSGDPMAFRRLTVASGLANLADSALALVLAIWVKDLTGSDAAAGLTLAAFGLPGLLSPLLGHMADRVSRRRMIAASHAVGAAAVLPLLLVRDAADVRVIIAVTVVYSTVGFAAAAAQAGLVRDLVPDERLAFANGRLSAIDQAFRLVMPLIGAGVYVVYGPQILVVVASVSFVVAAVVVGRMRAVETPPAPADEREPLARELTAGFRHLAVARPLGRLTAALAVAFGAAGLLATTNFASIEQGLGRGPEMLGVLAAVQGVSAVAAGLVAGRVIARFGALRTMTAGLGATAFAVVPLAGTSLAAMMTALIVAGAGLTLSVVAFVTERQLRTPARLQGRVSAATHLVLNLPQVGMTAVAAGVIGVVDYRVLVAFAAIGVGAAAAVAGRAAGR